MSLLNNQHIMYLIEELEDERIISHHIKNSDLIESSKHTTSMPKLEKYDLVDDEISERESEKKCLIIMPETITKYYSQSIHQQVSKPLNMLNSEKYITQNNNQPMHEIKSLIYHIEFNFEKFNY